jgi:DNA-binding response OmpR family regulator
VSIKLVTYIGADDSDWRDFSTSLDDESIEHVRLDADDVYAPTTATIATGVVVLGPVATGLELLNLCRRVRSMTTAPISIVADELAEAEELRLVSAGACRIEQRPIRPRVLAAQIAAHLGLGDGDYETSVLEFRSVTMNTVERLVLVGAKQVGLTKTEFELLEHLMGHSRRVYTHAQLARWLWRDDWGVDHRRLEAHISRLRKKIVEAGGPVIIESVRGVGYRLGLEERIDTESRAVV